MFVCVGRALVASTDVIFASAPPERGAIPMVTLLVVPSTVSSAIADATTIEALASISQSIPSTVLTAGNRTPLDAPGVFECAVRALEVLHESNESAPAKRVIARHLTALVQGSRAHGMVTGDTRAREWAPGHAWNAIAEGSLGGIMSNVYDLQRGYSKSSESLSETGRKALKSLLFAIDSVIKAVVYRPETLDLDGFEDESGETF